MHKGKMHINCCSPYRMQHTSSKRIVPNKLIASFQSSFLLRKGISIEKEVGQNSPLQNIEAQLQVIEV